MNKSTKSKKIGVVEASKNPQLVLQTRIAEAIDELRPNLHVDGGDIKIVGIEEGILKVKLEGRCAECPMSNITLKWGVEDFVKARIPEIRKVELIQ